MIDNRIEYNYKMTTSTINVERHTISAEKLAKIQSLVALATDKTTERNGYEIPLHIDIVDSKILFLISYETANSLVEIKTVRYSHFKSHTTIAIKHKFDDDSTFNYFNSDGDMPSSDITNPDVKDDVININISMDVYKFLLACMSYISKTELKEYETS